MADKTRLAETIVLFVVALAWAGFVYFSGASHVAKAFMAVGFVLALMLLVTIRELKTHATISRWAAVGEPDEILAAADRQLAGRRSPKRRVPFQVYKAIALSMKGQWQEAIDVLDAVDFERMSGATRRTWQFLYYNNLLACYCFTGRLDQARTLLEDHIEPFGTIVRSAGTQLAVTESRSKLLYFEGELEEARNGFESLVDDVRLASASRALYHYFLGRIARDEGDETAANEHFSKAADMAPNTFAGQAVQDEPSGPS